MKSLYESLIVLLESIDNKYHYTTSLNSPLKSAKESDMSKTSSAEEYVSVVQEVLTDAVKNALKNKKSNSNVKILWTKEGVPGENELVELPPKFVEFIKEIYDFWKTNFDLAPASIPFRFNNVGGIKLTDLYCNFINDKDFADQFEYAVGWNRMSETRKIGGVSIKVGNGFGGGGKGYALEDSTLDALVNYMIGGCENSNVTNDPSTKKILDNIIDSDLSDILNKVAIELKEKVKNVDDEERNSAIKKHIEKTGQQSTIRKDFQKFLAELVSDLPADTDASEVKATASIISDITLRTDDNEVYLSLKDSSAQLSGVIISPKTRGSQNRWMDDVMSSVNIKNTDTDNSRTFKKFFGMFGLDPEQIYETFHKELNKRSAHVDLKVNKRGVDNKAVGEMIGKLIGTGYWYVSPKVCVKVPDKFPDLKFIPDSAYASPKCINIKGTLNGCETKIVIRTASGKDIYPNRMFPVIDVDNFIKTIGIEK